MVFLAALDLLISKIPQIIVLINGTASGLCLLYGANRFNATAIFIHIILSILEKVLMLVIGIVLFVDPSHMKDLGIAIIFVACSILPVMVLWVCLGMYFLVCMYRFYKQVKSGMIASSSKLQFKKDDQICDFWMCHIKIHCTKIWNPNIICSELYEMKLTFNLQIHLLVILPLQYLWRRN